MSQFLRSMPLIEIPAHGCPPGPAAGSSTDTLALFLSGDGGWAHIDRALGHDFARQGIAVVGFNSLRYFWRRRTPEGAALDLERVLRHYQQAWRKSRLLLVGYSRGANVLPFIVNHLPADLRAAVRLLVLLSPGQAEEFKIRLRDWFEDLTEHLHHWGVVDDHFDLPDPLKALPAEHARPLLPELEKLRGLMRILCIYGEKEKRSLGRLLDPTLARVIPLAGGHHFDRNYPALARLITSVMHEA